MENQTEKSVLVDRMPLKVPNRYLGLISLNRPSEMNPLGWSTVKELRAAVENLSTDRAVRVIAVTGAGKSFSAGGDLKGYLALYRNPDSFRQFLDDFFVTLNLLENCAQPVVALVNGYCVAGGLELLLACDFAYAAKSAKIGDGHVNFGQIGGAGGNVRLPRCILPPRARELLYTGKLLSADEALQWGLVNRVVSDGELIDAALEFANVVADKSALGIGLMKEICNRSIDLELDDALRLEIEKNHRYGTTSHDAYEGLLAFSEKRKPEFKGR